MDFFNKSLGQIIELFVSMSAGARITASLLLAVVVISILYMFNVQTQQADEFLMGGRGFAPQELVAIEAAFGKAGLGQYEIQSNRVLIPKGERNLYIAAIADGDALPRDFGSYMEQLGTEASPWVTGEEKRLKYKSAKERELSLIISRLQGVNNATVQFSEHTEGGFPKRVVKTALVAVEPVGRGSVSGNQVKAIRDAVSTSEAGLKRENVTVMDLASGVSYRMSDTNTPNPVDNPYIVTKQHYEKDWQRKIEERLRMYGDVIVKVNVEVDPEIGSSQNSKTIGDAKPLHSEDLSSTVSTKGAAPGGAAGARPNGVGNEAKAIAVNDRSESESSETRSVQNSVAGVSVSRTEKMGLIPTHVQASIGVPSYYITELWKQNNMPADGSDPGNPDAAAVLQLKEETRNKIEKAVSQLLPKVADPGDDPFPRVVIQFEDSIKPPPLETPSAVERAQIWFSGHWQAISMICVAVVALLMLRGVITSIKPLSPSEVAAEIAEANALINTAAEEDAEEEYIEVTGADGSVRRLKKGRDIRAELAEIVRQDPDAAANVLRGWIGEAA